MDPNLNAPFAHIAHPIPFRRVADLEWQRRKDREFDADGRVMFFPLEFSANSITIRFRRGEAHIDYEFFDYEEAQLKRQKRRHLRAGWLFIFIKEFYRHKSIEPERFPSRYPNMKIRLSSVVCADCAWGHTRGPEDHLPLCHNKGVAFIDGRRMAWLSDVFTPGGENAMVRTMNGRKPYRCGDLFLRWVEKTLGFGIPKFFDRITRNRRDHPFRRLLLCQNCLRFRDDCRVFFVAGSPAPRDFQLYQSFFFDWNECQIK